MSSDGRHVTSFDRWAFIGAMALGLVGFGAFLARRGDPGNGAASATDGTSAPRDILRVRIGGPERPSDPTSTEGSIEIEAPEAANVPETPAIVAPDVTPGDLSPASYGTPPATRIVVVRGGETLGQIVQRELGTTARLDEVVRLNGLDDPNTIREGARLLFPVE